MSDEKVLQVPFTDEYLERLRKRAVDNDRVISREAAWIVKAVLDGRYTVLPFSAPSMNVTVDPMPVQVEAPAAEPVQVVAEPVGASDGSDAEPVAAEGGAI